MRDTSNRREKISSMLKKDGSVQVMKLAERFGVSTVTVRKDLRFLESLGVATRTYGGAMLNESTHRVIERAIEQKQQLFAREKGAIGAAAAKLVDSGDSIILDSGTTTYQIASRLGDKRDVTVISNGLNLMNKLSQEEELELIMLGGTLRRKNMSFFGAHAEQVLSELHVDKLFLGVDGFDIDRGITTHFAPEAQLNKLMCSAASKTIVVTDSSKIGRICLHQIIDLNKVSMVITDSGIPDGYRDRLQAFDIDLVITE